MDDFFPEIEINQDQAKAIAQGLFTIARADGEVHAAEAALINDFYLSTTDLPGELGSLERSPDIEGEILVQFLPTKAHKELFIKTGLLVAYADGTYGKAEAKLIQTYARCFGLTDTELTTLHSAVKEFLLSQLSHLKNTEASVKVAKELGI